MELPDALLQDLLRAARDASGRAYAPYSGFPVGAALLTDTGRIYLGCNVENASYGLTLCAERNAIVGMVSDGQRRLVALAIYTPTATPTAPCGACRQVIHEFGAAARIIGCCDTDARLDLPLSNLLPQAFGPQDLSG